MTEIFFTTFAAKSNHGETIHFCSTVLEIVGTAQSGTQMETQMETHSNPDGIVVILKARNVMGKALRHAPNSFAETANGPWRMV